MLLLGFLGGGITWAVGKCPRSQGSGYPFTTRLPLSQGTRLYWYVAISGHTPVLVCGGLREHTCTVMWRSMDLLTHVLPASLSYNQKRPVMIWPWTISILLLSSSSPSWPHWFSGSFCPESPWPSSCVEQSPHCCSELASSQHMGLSVGGTPSKRLRWPFYVRKLSLFLFHLPASFLPSSYRSLRCVCWLIYFYPEH